MPQARGRLAWLDISLPQRGAEGLTTIIPAVFRLLTNKEVTLPAFSITSALPSLMNGGKDFSTWSKKGRPALQDDSCAGGSDFGQRRRGTCRLRSGGE